MEIVAQADEYAPSVNDTGMFVDVVPSFTAFPQGIRCPCCARKNKIYETSSIFAAHIKTKHHKTWLQQLNLNKVNLYIENERNKTLVKQQYRIIADMETEIRCKTVNIEVLLKQLTMTHTYTEPTNLMDIN